LHSYAKSPDLTRAFACFHFHLYAFLIAARPPAFAAGCEIRAQRNLTIEVLVKGQSYSVCE
jgi:hypothetical protein